MVFFSFYGDLPMCRYLFHVRGAVTTTAAREHRSEPDDEVELFPIYTAAVRLKFDVVKWLYKNGAKDEIFNVGGDGCNAISSIFRRLDRNEDRIAVANWLVMEGMLEGRAGNTELGKFVGFMDAMRRIPTRLKEWEEVHDEFLGWMEKLLAPSNAFHTFLLGTVRTPQYSLLAIKQMIAEGIGSAGAASMLVGAANANGTTRDIWDQLMKDNGRPTSNNACLASFPGILEKIGDFVGIMKSKQKIRRIKSALHLTANRIRMREVLALDLTANRIRMREVLERSGG